VATIQPVVQHVACVFMAWRNSGYDFILAHSRRNGFEAFGGSIEYGNSPRDCINSLLQNIGFHVTERTPYFDAVNPADGKLTRIYVLFTGTISCRALNQIIQANPVISAAFHFFVRFPLQNVLRSPHSFNDDCGNPRNCTTFARSILTKIAQNHLRYV
jgi:hypothetical protein